jgi:hypothetical protein
VTDLHPTKTRTAFAAEVHAGRIRWYRHATAVAHHTVTGRKHTADLDELVAAGLARIPPCDPGLSSIAELTPAGICHFGLGEGPVSTSPETGPRVELNGVDITEYVRPGELNPDGRDESTKDGTR